MHTFFDFFRNLFLIIYSIVKAFLRLCLVTVIFFLDGLNHVLFSRCEIRGFDFDPIYWEIDEEKISYIDKLKRDVGSPSQGKIIDELDQDYDDGDDDENFI